MKDKEALEAIQKGLRYGYLKKKKELEACHRKFCQKK